jgi:hypothetical protein
MIARLRWHLFGDVVISLIEDPESSFEDEHHLLIQ